MRWLHVAVAHPPLLTVMAAVLLAMGRSPLCSCGLALWSGDIWSPSASQLIADAYSFVHVLHGVLFFWLTRAIWRSASVQIRLVYVTTFAIAWELIENSEFVIHRYREATISAAYTGDSILNSTSDVLFCLVGFFIASRLSGRASALMVVATEVVLALWIRDGLLLNVIMLLHPIDAIRRWQLGG
jgi:hypothetical protein